MLFSQLRNYLSAVRFLTISVSVPVFLANFTFSLPALFGSCPWLNHATRCVFAALLAPPHDCAQNQTHTHAHKLVFFFWNKELKPKPLHSNNWYVSLLSISSRSTRVVSDRPHKGVVFSVYFSLSLSLSLCRPCVGVLPREIEKESRDVRGKKGRVVQTLWRGWERVGVQQLFLVFYSSFLPCHLQCDQSPTMQPHSPTHNKETQMPVMLPCFHHLLFLLCFQPGKQKRKFSSFFKSLVIELDKELYGPDNHLVEVLHIEEQVRSRSDFETQERSRLRLIHKPLFCKEFIFL